MTRASAPAQAANDGLHLPGGDDALGGVELPVQAGGNTEILAFPADAELALAFWRQYAPMDKDIDDVGTRGVRASDNVPPMA